MTPHYKRLQPASGVTRYPAREDAALDRVELAELREEYLHEVIAALGVYLKGGEALSLDSSRDAEDLIIAFRLSAPAEYHSILNGLLAGLPIDEPRGSTGD